MTEESPISNGSAARAKKSSKSGKRVDNALGISQFLLGMLQQVTNNTPVPGLSQAAGAACALLQMVSVSDSKFS